MHERLEKLRKHRAKLRKKYRWAIQRPLAKRTEIKQLDAQLRYFDAVIHEMRECLE